jgi:hypothetical protein
VAWAGDDGDVVACYKRGSGGELAWDGVQWEQQMA